MPRSTYLQQAFCVYGLLLLVSLSLARADDQISVRIGIQVKDGNRTTWAKANDRLRGGSRLHVYVLPESDAYVYVVHSDGKEATLLNHADDQKVIKKGSTLALPSEKEFYQIDGSSPFESFSIVCSPHEIKRVSNALKTGKTTHKQWNVLAKTLKNNTGLVDEEIKKPSAMAGSVRGIADHLRAFSGNSFVIVQYEFSVKK